jgi:hypothetical protein
MTHLHLAEEEWTAITQPAPKTHHRSRKPVTHPFRRFGQALAWVEFDAEQIEIKKLEMTVHPAKGAATLLLEALKAIATKHELRITGAAIAYLPDPPVPPGPFLSQKELEDWYRRRGFQLVPDRSCITIFWYPDVPRDAKGSV